MIEILNQHFVLWAFLFMSLFVFGSVFLCAEKGSSGRKWVFGLFVLTLVTIPLYIYVFVLGVPGLR